MRLLLRAVSKKEDKTYNHLNLLFYISGDIIVVLCKFAEN